MTSLFVRSKNLIWYVNIGGETGKTATWASLDFDKAGDILNELFTLVGAPAAVKPASASKAQKTGKTKFCPTCGKGLHGSSNISDGTAIVARSIWITKLLYYSTHFQQ